MCVEELCGGELCGGTVWESFVGGLCGELGAEGVSWGSWVGGAVHVGREGAACVWGMHTSHQMVQAPLSLSLPAQGGLPTTLSPAIPCPTPVPCPPPTAAAR